MKLTTKQLRAKIQVFTLSEKTLEVDFRGERDGSRKQILLGALDSVRRQKRIAEEKLNALAR